MDEAYRRTLRLYSYDDEQLIAYWKLTEPYTSSDIEYTINDYSYNMNMISYSRNSKPAYPFFNKDLAYTLNL